MATHKSRDSSKRTCRTFLSLTIGPCRSLLSVIAEEKTASSPIATRFPNPYGFTRDYTVGCAALDKKGNLAAGTSTGGLTNKRWGRIGDSPIIGAGTYADNATCAVSGTGIGELFIQNSAAFQVSALMAYKGLSLDEAVRHVLEKVLPPGTGGMIAVDRRGHVSMHCNTPGMARAAADSTGKVDIGLMK